MRTGRKWDEIREPKIQTEFCPNSDGSVLFEMGGTGIICAASISNEVPSHAESSGKGWLTAEYSLLPYSTSPRTKRSILKKDGRSVEIQRLIGRSLRGIIDLGKIPGYTITIDCDVLKADGGTRTASITGSYIALKMAVDKMLKLGLIDMNPLYGNIAAISVGYLNNNLLLDLDYSEDSKADVDLNIVMDDKFNLIEIQGTAEKETFTIKQLNQMIELAQKGITELINFQNKF